MEKDFSYTNELTFSKKDIYEESVDLFESTDDIDNNIDDFIIDIFDYENIVMEYDFKTGSSSIYLQKSENVYELLYDTTIENRIENSYFYSKDSVYTLTNYDHKTGNIQSLDYWKKSDFITFLKNFYNETTNTFKKLKSSLFYIPFMLTHSKRIIEDNKHFYTDTKPELFNNYKKLFVKYYASAKLIPAFCILESLISDIHNYIATKKFEKAVFEKRLSELQNFKDVCPSSISALNSFLRNPTQTDLHQICDLLKKNLNNIDKLIQIYLEDELNIQEEGEKYDSK